MIDNYFKQTKYQLTNLDNTIYLYDFDNTKLTIDDNNITKIDGTSSSMYCESVTYESKSSINNRFSFINTITVTLQETKENTNYDIIQSLITRKWLVCFRNKQGDIFIMNAEYPSMVTYSYQFTDDMTPNTVTITFGVTQNQPTLHTNEDIIVTSIFRDKPCEYSLSKIVSLQMVDVDKANIQNNEEEITIFEKGIGSIKTIEYNSNSISFVDSYNGMDYNQELTFEIPFEDYHSHFKYDLLKFIDNRYYVILNTNDGNVIIGGYYEGMFPSYDIIENKVQIKLLLNKSNYSIIGSNSMDIITNEGYYYNPISATCVNNIYTWVLIEEFENDTNISNGYYCLNGYQDEFSNYNIKGTYEQFNVGFGFSIVNYNISCAESCIKYMPHVVKSTEPNVTQCFDVEADCSVKFFYNTAAVSVTFNNQLCITPKLDNATAIITATTDEGDTRYITVIMGDGGGGITRKHRTNHTYHSPIPNGQDNPKENAR